MDIFDKIGDLSFIEAYKSSGLYPYFRELEKNQGTVVEYQGQKLIMLGSNNYLGLAQDARVIEAAVAATKAWGSGCTGSRVLNGNLSLHEALETALAEFLNTQSALVFSCGFTTNLGAISALCGPEDVILSDKENHASILEGCRVSRAKLISYRNCDLEHLEQQLNKLPLEQAKLIITDGVFSMSGQIAPLKEITQLAQRFNARTYVDDAHGLGVIGEGGRGTASHHNALADITMGTFSKTLGSQGGFIAGERQMIEYLRHSSRTLIFSAATSPSNAAAALKALEIVRQEPERIETLHRNAQYLKNGLKHMGLNTLGTETSIVPVLVADDQKAFILCKRLLELGVFTTPVIFPATARGKALIRCSVTSAHSLDQLDQCLEAFQQVALQIIAANDSPNKTILTDLLKSNSSKAHSINPSLLKELS